MGRLVLLRVAGLVVRARGRAEHPSLGRGPMIAEDLWDPLVGEDHSRGGDGLHERRQAIEPSLGNDDVEPFLKPNRAVLDPSSMLQTLRWIHSRDVQHRSKVVRSGRLIPL